MIESPDPTPPEAQHLQRATDQGWLCIVALRAGQFWEWIDRRDIDKHTVSLAILSGTAIVTKWAMHYAENGERPGLEIAAILAAVLAPYMALQAAAIKWYFEGRR